MAEKGRWTIEGDDLVYRGPIKAYGTAMPGEGLPHVPMSGEVRWPAAEHPELAAKVRAIAARDAPRPRQYSDLSDWEKLFTPASLDW